MAAHITIWPPPWERNSPLRWAAYVLWLIAMAPVLALAFVVAMPIGIVTTLTGWGKAKLTREEVCLFIEQFVDGSDGAFDWDDFISVPIADPELEQVRQQCEGLCDLFPPESRGQWCGPGGVDELRRIARDLRGADLKPE